MNTVSAFITEHWVLFTLFLIAFFWLIYEESRHQGAAGGVRQTPQGVIHLVNREHAVLMDLRDPSAFRDGAIANSLNIPYSQIEQKLIKLEKYKNKPIVLVCAMGPQSVKAMHKLKKLGFTKLYLLGGGLGAWKKAGLPLKKS